MKIRKKGYTFDDVLLVPFYSEVLPSVVNVGTKLSKNITMNIPIVSAAMDTVTEEDTAIAMARLGGIGIVHKNMDMNTQAKKVKKVKKSENGIIYDPICINPNSTLTKARDIMQTNNISGIPIVNEDKTLLGIITNRDLLFQKLPKKPLHEAMTAMPLITIKTSNNTKTTVDLEQAEALMHEHKVEKLPVIDNDNKLIGLVTMQDMIKRKNFPNANKDSFGRLRVGAAVGAMQYDRIKKLIDAGVDILVIDSAHGHSKGILDTLKYIKANFNIEVIAGNIATKEASMDLIKAGADGIKVGIGPGSICTTRVIAGVGFPQLSAIEECASLAKEYGVPVIADGGIKYSGDIAKALAVGASSIMAGSILAGTEESPGSTITFQGRQYKNYRGMGSIGAMEKGSGDRYFQEYVKSSKLVPEGVEGRVPYRGKLADIIYQLIGGLKASMGYLGAKDIATFQDHAHFVEITSSGLKESHVHDVIITKENPNYHQ